MNLESSHKHAEQAPPPSDAPAETGYSQENGNEEPLASNGTSAGVPLDPEELIALLLGWLRTPDWLTSQKYLQAHAELLTETAEQALLATLVESKIDPRAHQILTTHYLLLQTARQQGVGVAYQPFLHQEKGINSMLTEQEELEEQILTWLQMPDWETSQAYLQAHPGLLTDAAEQLLEALKDAQHERRAQALLTTHQTLVKKAREEGIEAAYERFLVSEPEISFPRQEMEQFLIQIEEWVMMPDWQQSQTYLQAHPDLHTETAEELLAALLNGQEADYMRVVLSLHLQLLQRTRETDIAVAYETFLNRGTLESLGRAAFYQYWTSGEMTDLNRALAYWQAALDLIPLDASDRPAMLADLGAGLLVRCKRTGELADIDAAISVCQQAVQASSPDSPNWPLALNNLGAGLLDRYARNRDVTDLDTAISICQQAVGASSSDSPNWPGYLNNLGVGLRGRYDSAGDPTDLDAAISAYQQAVGASSLNTPSRHEYLANLGESFLDRYARNRDLADLDAAIVAWQQSVQATSPDSPAWPKRMGKLGATLLDRYIHGRDLVDLNASILAYQQALQATSLDSTDRSEYLTSFSAGLIDRYIRTREQADLDAAVIACQQLIQVTPTDVLERSDILSYLGNGLRDRYTRTRELVDLDTAIDVLQHAVQATLPDSPDQPIHLTDLSNGLLDRYAHTGDLADLDAAILASQQAVQAIPPSSPHQPTVLSNLGAGLLDRYAHTSNRADLDTAIDVLQHAVQAAPLDSPDRPAYLANLGNALRNRHTHTGNRVDLDTAITAYQQSLQATVPDSPDRPAMLSNVGAGLFDRYTITGELTDLEAAVSAWQQSVQATSPDSSERPKRLSNVGNGLRERYARTGNLTDLEASIMICEQTIQATSPTSPHRPGYLNNLANGLRTRYMRTGEQADLDAAISAWQQSVQAISLEQPKYLNNLGNALLDRYIHTGKLADLDAAILACQQAVQATSPDSPEWPGYLSNLANGLRNRYVLTGDQTDLDIAISAWQQSIRNASPDSPWWTGYLSNLGAGLFDRYTSTGELTDLDAAISTWQQGIQGTPSDSLWWPAMLNNLGAGLSERYTRTRELTDLETAISMWERSWSLSHSRFVALPVAYQLGQQRQEFGVAAHLVTAYLEVAKQHRSRTSSVSRRMLEVAEGSKSRLLTQLIGRGSLSLPEGLSPEIAAQEHQLLAELTALDTQELANHQHLASNQEKTGRLQQLQQRQASLKELEELWMHIASTSTEGTAYVTLRRGTSLTWQDFARLAKGLGPENALLSFFLTADRALFFIIRTGWRAPRVVEISLTLTLWADVLERFFREVHRYSPSLLRGETWDQALRPLLTKMQPSLEKVERVLLAPVGPGHLLPWGVLGERAGWRTATGRPLPLITLPALGVLPRLRQRMHMPPGPVLVVGNPRGDLPYAEIEAKEVAASFGTHPLLGADATTSAVLARLSEANVIHFATHASFQPDNPLESGVVLADGVLTARDILQHRLKADLLVLSACESGRVGSLGGEELAGLSQAFLQAGTRSLLVSLWKVNDPATAALMHAFYTARQAGADKAQALREAMTQIQQDSRWSHPYYWGAFTLIGDWD